MGDSTLFSFWTRIVRLLFCFFGGERPCSASPRSERLWLCFLGTNTVQRLLSDEGQSQGRLVLKKLLKDRCECRQK
ncbi:hypothetical protein C8J56DRAFT_959148 [Mycena floridula]|nr:hypothetical protein C8J56DRAFT_959148 [Mycena floridula]